MSFHPPSPDQEFKVTKEDGDGLAPMAHPNEDQIRRESSEDDGPIMARRQVREPAKERDEGIALRERRSRRDELHDSADQVRDRPMPRQSLKPSPKSAVKHKKPGPRAWAAKPIMKNDMKAKKEVIREIEGYWGKGFIRSYIPKCHRPLVKRGKLGKRSIYRDHETNPKNWLPSVLKAILMIAKLTDDKVWLKEAMNDVVRYRIKHTGNRKPQLVTTDFDVIEDMLVKQWNVAYAFEIRYKHLLVNRKDQQETDEDIDHILQVGSEPEEGSDNDDDDDDMEDQEEEDDYDDEKDEGEMGQGGISNKYLKSSGYVKASPYPPPAPPRQQAKQQKTHGETPAKQAQHKQTPPPQGVYGYSASMPSYSPAIDPWGRPLPAYSSPDGYGGFDYPGGAYGSYGGYGPPQYGGKNVRQGSVQPPQHVMQQYPRYRPITPTPDRGALSGYPPIPDIEMPGRYQGGRTKIKRESPPHNERPMAAYDVDSPTNDLGPQHDEFDDDDDDDKAAVEAEMQAVELELKLAKLRAKLASKQNGKGK
jgi:hypothetical protein